MPGVDSSILRGAIVVTPCLVALLLALYTLWLRRAPAAAAVADPSAVDWPAIDVIVAAFNERSQIEGKLDNLAQLEYPHDRVRFLIVDGGSTDGSREVTSAWPLKDERFVALTFEPRNKTAQLNAGLRHAHAPWIVVTDADARMPAGTLRALMTAARDQPAVGAIGTPVLPVTAHAAEQMYWRILNWLRRSESRRGSAAMVMAPCYAFRRRLIDQLADDAVADDVHVAWRIGCAGHPIGFAGPVVHEVRGPQTIRSLFAQKVRRAGGILQEAFRFAPRADGMVRALRVGFAVRFGLLLVAPVLVACIAALGVAITMRLLSSDPGSGLLTTAVVAICTPTLSRRIRKTLGLVALLALAASVSLLVYSVFRPVPPPGGAPHRVLRKAR